MSTPAVPGLPISYVDQRGGATRDRSPESTRAWNVSIRDRLSTPGPLDVLRRLYRHLQLKSTWRKAIDHATCLVADGGLKRLVVLLGQGYWYRDSDLALIHMELLIQPHNVQRMWRRPLRGADNQPCHRGNVNRHRRIAGGNRLAVHVQTRGNGEFHCKPEALEKAVGIRVEICTDLHPFSLGVDFSTMPRAGNVKTLLQEPYTSLAFAIALLKALLDHISVCVQHEHARVRDTPDTVLLGDAIGGVVFVDLVIEQAQGTDNSAALIGE